MDDNISKNGILISSLPFLENSTSARENHNYIDKMRVTTLVNILASIAAIGVRSENLQRRDCPANNCAREITGTDAHITPDPTVRLADCSSYMTATLIPPAA
jgi:hypothetical protein